MKIKNKTFCKKMNCISHKNVLEYSKNVNELHFCNSEAYTEIS